MRVKWRKDSALNDQGNKGEDLTGGYYDGTFFLKVGPNWSSFIYYDPFYRTYKYTMTQINFFPSPSFMNPMAL